MFTLVKSERSTHAADAARRATAALIVISSVSLTWVKMDARVGLQYTKARWYPGEDKYLLVYSLPEYLRLAGEEN